MRDLQHVKLLAATKAQPPEKINAAIRAGISLVGENYVQEAAGKFPHLLPVEKHFIGHLQRNKVRQAGKIFDCIQSIDSVQLLEKVQDCYPDKPVFMQVNLGDEETKHGFHLDEMLPIVKQWNGLMHIKGIMAVAPLQDPEKNRMLFHTVHRVFEQCRRICPTMREVCMGTSNDYKVAIAEGATMVRLGTMLFGSRR